MIDLDGVRVKYRSDSTGHRYKVISVIFHYNFPQIPEINIIRKHVDCSVSVAFELLVGLSNYLVEIPGVFASFCRDLLQAPKLFQKVAIFVFLAHFAVRSFELLGRNTRCVCELLP